MSLFIYLFSSVFCHPCSIFQFCKSAEGFIQSFLASGEMQTNEMIYIFFEETGAGDGGQTDFSYHPFAEFQIRPVVELGHGEELADIDHNEVSTLWYIMYQTDLI